MKNIFLLSFESIKILAHVFFITIVVVVVVCRRQSR